MATDWWLYEAAVGKGLKPVTPVMADHDILVLCMILTLAIKLLTNLQVCYDCDRSST